MDRQQIPLKRLAKLYGVVVPPEEARKFYRRHAQISIGVVWGINLCFGIVMLIMAYAGGLL